MDQNAPNDETVKVWTARTGALLANFPYVQECVVVVGNVDCDPEPLSAQLRKASDDDPDTPVGRVLTALLNCVERRTGTILAEMADMEDRIQSQANKIRELKEENSDLKDDWVRIGRKNLEKTEAGGGYRRKITKEPKIFDASEKNTVKRQEQYEEFRTDVNRVLTTDERLYPTEFDKISHLDSHLGGDARRNNALYFDKVLEFPKDPDQWVEGWRTVAQIWRNLNAQYVTQDLARKAKMDYDDILMNKRAFGDFVAEFYNLATRCGKTKSQMVSDLKLKVSDELIKASVHRQNKPGDEDYAGWVRMWQEIWNEREEAAHNMKVRANKGVGKKDKDGKGDSGGGHSKTPAPLPPPVAPQPRPEQTGDPMDLDAAKMGNGGYRTITREECIARDLCLFCKKPGHQKWECEKKKLSDARKAAAGIPPRGYGSGLPRYGNQYGGSQYGGGRGRSPNRAGSPYPGAWNQGPALRQLEQEPNLGGYVEGSVSGSQADDNKGKA